MYNAFQENATGLSCPARGTGIEMYTDLTLLVFNATRRAPHGARGLKFEVQVRQEEELRVVPRTGHGD